MRRYIEHLKTKPEHHRKQIAFAVSAVIMIGIVGIWISTFPMKLEALHALRDSLPTEALTAGIQNAQAQAASPLEALQQSLSAGFDNANDSGAANSNDVLISDPNQDSISADSYIQGNPSSNVAQDSTSDDSKYNPFASGVSITDSPDSSGTSDSLNNNSIN